MEQSFLIERASLAGCAVWFVVVAWRLWRQGDRVLGGVSFGLVTIGALAQPTISPGIVPMQVGYLATVGALAWFLVVGALGRVLLAAETQPRRVTTRWSGPGGSVMRVASSCAVGVAVLWLMSGNGTATREAKPASAESARIAFGSHRDGNWEVYVTDADGQNQTRLTRRNGHTRFPLWSPDRTQIAFATQVGGPGDGWDFWVMNADGSGARRLCSGLVGKSGREWSPDGRRIALTRSDGDNMDVYVVEVASGQLSRMTTAAGQDRDPAWSPDGTHIVFTSERDGNREIYVARTDGGNVRRLTNEPAKDASPAWSPDGSRILFVSERTGTSELHLMTADGLRVDKLTSEAYASSDVPRWSPDGSHVAFQIAEGSRYDIGVLRLRDRQQKVLVGTPGNDGSYTWSPDGTRLAYIAGRSGAENLYVIEVESHRSTRITATWSLTPSWTR